MNGLYRPTKERDGIVHVCSFLSLLNCRRFTFEAEHLYDEKRMGYTHIREGERRRIERDSGRKICDRRLWKKMALASEFSLIRPVPHATRSRAIAALSR